MNQNSDENVSLSSQEETRILLSQKSLDNIDQYYNEFIEESKKDRVLSRFDIHIRTIYDSFQIVLRNETDLFNKLSVSKRDLNDLNMKYSQALKLSSVDSKAKTDLLEEIEKAWHQATLAKNKEKRTLETVDSLKLEIYNLSKLVEQDVGLTMGQEYNLREIKKQKEDLIVENKKLVEDFNVLKAEMNVLKQKDDEYNKLYEEAKVQVSQANHELLACKLEIQKLSRKNEQLEEEIANQRKIVENKDLHLLKSAQALQAIRLESNKHEQSVKDTQFSLEKNKKELEIQNNRYQKLQNEIDQLFIKNDSLMIENSQLSQIIRKKDETIEGQKFENIQTQKMRDAFERKIKLIEDQKKEILSDKLTFEAQLDSIKKVNESLEKEKELDKKQIDALVNEKEQLYSQLKKSNSEILKLSGQIKASKLELKGVEHENFDLKSESEKLKKNLLNFEKEKLKYLESLNEINLKFSNLNEELKIKDLSIIDCKKKYIESETRLKDLSRLYENTRTDRNLYSKHLIESKDEIKEIKTKIDSFVNLEQNLEKSIKKKNVTLVRLKKDNVEFKQKSTKLVSKLDKNQLLLNDFRAKIDLLELNESKYLKIISFLENRCDSLEINGKKLDTERNILGSQLVRRNDEISLLNEKVRLLENVLKRGEICYQKLQEELRLSKNQLKMVKKQKDFFKSDKKLVKDLKRELMLNERDLIIEKAKRSAFEKIQKSINIHRWRKLRGCDPSAYELILKVNILQKSLIYKSEQLVCMELKFQEKDRLFVELNQYFSRRVLSDESSEIIEKYKTSLSNTSRKLKSFIAENNMLTDLTTKQKLELSNAQEELKEIKMKYLSLKSSKVHLGLRKQQNT